MTSNGSPVRKWWFRGTASLNAIFQRSCKIFKIFENTQIIFFGEILVSESLGFCELVWFIFTRYFWFPSTIRTIIICNNAFKKIGVAPSFSDDIMSVCFCFLMEICLSAEQMGTNLI